MTQLSLPQDLDLAKIESTLLEAADAAAKVSLPFFRSRNLLSDNKLSAGFDPVTEADKQAELEIRRVIEGQFPDHQIVGEEHANKETDSPFAWTIDPIDGTRAFISGLPVWGTLIGLSYQEKNFAGIMGQPYIGENFVGLPGRAYLSHKGNEHELSTSGVTDISQAKLFTTTPALFTGEKKSAYDRVEAAVRLPRYGCDCYGYALLAAGHADLVVECGLNAYDIAALIPIIENAGGVITSVDGGPADQGGDVIAAATPELHETARKLYLG